MLRSSDASDKAAIRDDRTTLRKARDGSPSWIHDCWMLQSSDASAMRPSGTIAQQYRQWTAERRARDAEQFRFGDRDPAIGRDRTGQRVYGQLLAFRPQPRQRAKRAIQCRLPVFG